MSAELLKSLQEMDPQVEDSVSAEACCKLADAAFKEMQMELAFSICRAGVHKHLNSSDKLCKRYLFMLEMLAKNALAGADKVEGPPRMLYLRELYDKLDATVKKDIAKAGWTPPGDKFVLMKQLGVMVMQVRLAGQAPCTAWRRADVSALRCAARSLHRMRCKSTATRPVARFPSSRPTWWR